MATDPPPPPPLGLRDALGAWLALSAGAAVLAYALARAELDAKLHLSALEWACLLAATAPLLGAQLALGLRPVFAALAAWSDTATPATRRHAAHAAALGIAALFALAGAAAGRFDPYATAIIALGAVAALGALGDLPRGTAGLTWTDGAVWLLLWIPFDLRWYDDGLWQGPRGFTYAWWALAISVLAALGWGPLRALPGLGYRLLPTVRDLGIALATLGLIAAALIPIGLALHFLHFPPSRTADPWEVAATFLGLFFTVALPEELFFRAVLQNGLERGLRRPAAAAVLAALAFGLMHWNNANSLRERIVYCALASVAGGLYGWAWRRSGGLAAPVLVHTLVDLVWKFLLR